MSNATANVAAPRLNPDTLEAQAHALIGDSAAWWQSHWLQILIAAGVGAAIVFALIALRGWVRKWCARPGAADGWGFVLARVASRTGRFFIVMVAARLVVGYADAPPGVFRTVTFLFTIAAVFQAAIWARELILGAIDHRTAGQDRAALGSAMGIIRLLVTFALFAIALIVVLDNLGVNVTGLVAGLGVGGIAIGLAAQGIFGDLFAALAIIFDKPFRVGDTISYDQTTGKVEAIGLKSTRVRSATGEQRIIANKQLLDKEVQNISQRDHRRVTFVLGLVGWTPVETMRRVPDMLREIVEAAGQTFVHSGFVNFGTSSFDIQLEFDAPAAFEEMYAARHEIGLAIIDRLNREGIELAYPTQTSFTAAPDGRLIMPYPEPRTG